MDMRRFILALGIGLSMFKCDEEKPGKRRVETQQYENLTTAGRYLEPGGGKGRSPACTQEGRVTLLETLSKAVRY